jgi:hypothetical protein
MTKFFFLLLAAFFTHQVVAQQHCKCAFEKKAPKGTPFHLYSPETEIVVLSYKALYDTMKIKRNDGTIEFQLVPAHPNITIKSKKYSLPAAADSIILVPSQKEKLFKILHLYQIQQTKCTITNSNCYQPHHLILFYQKKKIVAFIEICFSCYGNISKGISYSLFACAEKYDLLKNFFKEIGIKRHLKNEYGNN